MSFFCTLFFRRLIKASILIAGFTITAKAQVTISGPGCATAGPAIKYTYNGTYGSTTTITWDLVNGVFNGTSNTHASGTFLLDMYVVWHTGSSSGTIGVSSPYGGDLRTITIVPALNGGTISSTSQNINYNSIPATINCSAATNGNCSPVYSYQWQQSSDAVAFTDIANQTSLNLTFTSPLTTTTYYRRMVTETGSSTVAYSNTASVFIYPQLTSSISPANRAVNYNTSPGQITNTRNGGSGTYTYQWQSSPNNSTWTNISGATSQNYTPPSLTSKTYYRVVTTSNGVTVTSNTSTIDVYPAINAGTLSPATQTINYNTAPAQITSTAPSGGSGTYTYQWQSSANNSTWTNISGATAATYTSGALTATKYFRRGVISNGATVYTSSVVVTVYPQLVGGLLSPSTITVNYDDNPGRITGTAATGGTGSYTYAWQYSSNNSSWTTINSTNTLSYSPGTINSSRYYRRKATSNGATAYSNSVLIQYPLYGGIIASNTAVISSGSSVTLSSSAPAIGGSCGGSYTYQWQSSPDQITWNNISGTTVSNITATTFFQRVATCGTESAGSNVLVVKVQSTPATIIPTTSTGPTAGTQTAVAMPAYQSTVDTAGINYIKTRSFLKPGLSTEPAADAVSSNQDVQQTTSYFDGIGREMQTVAKQAAPAGRDIIKTSFYDAYGRVVQQYLPYTDNASTGGFRTDASTKQPAFYNTYLSNTEGYYYSNSVYESSPLNRVLKTTAPGKSWTGKNIGITVIERVNELYDSVIIWSIGYTTDILPAKSGNYQRASLFVTETTDENNNKVIEYKNKEGQVILKKVQILDGSLPGHYGWLCTYYVYDDFGNLRFVIPPKAVEDLQDLSWTFESTTMSGSTIAKELCFYYEYDAKKRMITKRVPGAGPVWMVYDARDRVVMTQDSALRKSGKWLYTDYDSLNRPVKTGLWTSSSNRTYHQAHADTSIIYPNPPTGSGNEVLTQTFYDDYSWASGVSLPFSGTALDNTYTGNTNYFYTASNATYPYPQAIASTTLVNGMVTGTKVEVLGSSGSYLYTANFYDARGRVIQVKKTNIDGGYGIITSQYDFSGKPLRVLETHKKTTTTTEHTVLTKMQYDAGGRLLKVFKKVDNSLETTISDNQYDELGNLKTKKLGLSRNTTDLLTYTSSSLETLDYTYNIRGWLLGINRGYALPSVYTTEASSQSNRWFGMRLSYDYGFNCSELNGNISGIEWRSKGDAQQRAYGFDYDNANRLLEADFTQNAGTNVWNTSAGIDFSASGLSYDANGNILAMKQMGLKLNASSLIDDLKYGYKANTNKLDYVTDIENDTSAHLGDFTEINNNTSSDYSYEGNGNLTKDNNKGISSISYNFLNLPDQIKVTGKGLINYTYDATGVKWRKTTTDSTASAKNYTTYIGSFTYQSKVPFGSSYNATNDTLQFIAQEEGRIRPSSVNDVDTMYYDYFIKDHLGNVRTVLTDQMQIDYYPAATLEGSLTVDGSPNDAYYEKNFYNIDPGNVVSKSVATGITTYQNNNGVPNPNPNSNTTANSQKLYRLTGTSTDGVTGLGITLKVMSGDKIDIFGKSYWFQNNTSGTNSDIPLADILAGMLATPSGVATGHGATLSGLTGGSNPTTIPSSFLTRNPPAGDQTPMAFINWILLDEQFHYVSGGFSKVGSNGIVKDHYSELQGIPVTKNGYIYVYASNQSPVAVFFDNLQVIHTRGPLLEENHYYPFGLTMSGISSKALNFGDPNNKCKYNKGSELQNKEFDDGSGLEWYATQFRSLDPQLGRWWQIDPKPGDMTSPYSAMENNPIYYNDFYGDIIDPGDDQAKKKYKELTEANQNAITRLLAEIVGTVLSGGNISSKGFAKKGK